MIGCYRYLTDPRSGNAVDVMRLSVELEADVTVVHLLLGAVEVAVQRLAGEILDAVVHLLGVGGELDQDVAEELDQLLVPELGWSEGRGEEEPEVDPGGAGEAHGSLVVAALGELPVLAVAELELAQLLHSFDVGLVAPGVGLVEQPPGLPQVSRHHHLQVLPLLLEARPVALAQTRAPGS